jgi:hypothetical protein
MRQPKPPKPIIQVAPGKLDQASIAKIERAGYLVVECNPGDMQSVTVASSPLEPNDLLMAAMHGLEQGRYVSRDNWVEFGQELRRRILANEEAARDAIERERP